MTLSVSTQVSPVGTKLVVDTEADATARDNVTGEAGTIYMVDVDNSANGDLPAYLKIFDAASVVPGTDAPDFIFKIPVNQRRPIVCPEGLDFTALSFICVTGKEVANVVSPTNPVIVRIVTS